MTILSSVILHFDSGRNSFTLLILKFSCRYAYTSDRHLINVLIMMMHYKNFIHSYCLSSFSGFCDKMYIHIYNVIHGNAIYSFTAMISKQY